jgi:hypothetical protein
MGAVAFLWSVAECPGPDDLEASPRATRDLDLTTHDVRRGRRLARALAALDGMRAPQDRGQLLTFDRRQQRVSGSSGSSRPGASRARSDRSQGPAGPVAAHRRKDWLPVCIGPGSLLRACRRKATEATARILSPRITGERQRGPRTHQGTGPIGPETPSDSRCGVHDRAATGLY